jgi:hypothetical protein
MINSRDQIFAHFAVKFPLLTTWGVLLVDLNSNAGAKSSHCTQGAGNFRGQRLPVILYPWFSM